MDKKVMEFSSRFIWMILILCISTSILSGIISSWYFSKYGNNEIVVLDVGKVIEKKKEEFIKKYKDREPSLSLKEEMEKEISSFVDSLNRIVGEESKGKIVLSKDSVISNAKDITDEVSKRIMDKN